MITSAFTCTGPYAILIMLGIKHVENRSMWPSPMKGRCAVSCSKSFCKEEFGNFVQWASRALPADQFALIPAWSDVADWPGKIVGCCDYAARTASAPYRGMAREPWDEGYGCWWDLSEVVSFDRPIGCRGNTGMWTLSMALAKQVTITDELVRTVGSKVSTAEDAAHVFRMAMPLAGENEGFFVLPLDADCHVLSEPILVALGESTTTAVDPAMVFGAALKCEAKSVIVAHNHPSGNPAPSLQDRQLTAALKRLGQEIGAEVRDHLVVGTEGIYSIGAAQMLKGL